MSGSMAVMIYRFHTVVFYAYGAFSKNCRSRRSGNGLSGSSVGLYFGGHCAAVTYALIHSLECSSLPRYAQLTR
ncbi:hypothetical protein TNCV_2144191 [Trichonephila clavipes]|nr:hypothetical protein TNCV_4569301 [Trichonephila clavipes]GFT96672.1 hypothetical protein TNCV_2144191 [Trichonephila clavipes]